MNAVTAKQTGPDTGRPAGATVGVLQSSVFSVVIMIACVIGNLGLALAMNRGWMLMLAGAAGLTVGMLVRATFPVHRKPRPAPRTVIVGGIGAIFPAAAGGLILVLLYSLIRWLLGRFNRFTDWMEWSFELPVLPWTVKAVVLLAFLFIPMFAWQAARQLGNYAYLAEVSPRDLHVTRAKIVRWSGTGAAAVLLFAGAAWAHSAETPKPVLAGFLASYAIGALSLGFWSEMGLRAGEKSLVTPTDRIRSALSEAGFELEPLPPSALGNADFLARRNGEALLVEIRTPTNTTSPVDWSAAASLKMARWQIAGSETSNQAAESIQPVLILVDVAEDKSLERPELREGVRIVHFEGRELGGGEQTMSTTTVFERLTGAGIDRTGAGSD